MKIYVLVYTNNFSPFYFLCITNMPHRFPTMTFTHINYTKTFHNKNLNSLHNSIPSSFYTHTTTYFYQVKVFSKVTNTHLYTNEKKIK